MQTITVAKRWDLAGRNERPDEQAMRDLLNRRYRFAVDDVPHRDLLDCVADDGSLQSILDPGSDT